MGVKAPSEGVLASPCNKDLRQTCAMHTHSISVCLALLALLVSVETSARCKFPGLDAEFREATDVYEATLIRAEYLRVKPDSAMDDDARQDLSTKDSYRFLLDVEHVYKGAPGRLVEKSKRVWGVTVTSGTPLHLEELRVGTRLLMFEPHWDSGCSPSAVIDDDTYKQVLPRLRELAAASAASAE